jgi:hypothetical protein
MGFKQAHEAVKKLQQTFSTTIPDSQGGSFTAYFRVLNGKEAIWSFRIRDEDTDAAFNIQYNLRAAIASLIKFEDEGNPETTLWPYDIIETLFSPEQLEDPYLILEPNAKDSAIRLLHKGYLEEIKRVGSDEELIKLTTHVQEFSWDLMLKGFQLEFDSEYLQMFATHYIAEYRRIRPSTLSDQLKSILMNVLDSKVTPSAETHTN